jgi:hypothetical protein
LQVFRLCEEQRDEAIHLLFTLLDCRVGFKASLLAMTIQVGLRWLKNNSLKQEKGAPKSAFCIQDQSLD